MNAPLADLMRPQTIDEVVGQSHILSKDGILYRIAQSGRATNLIFYGPPGTGKTTVARIIAKQAGKKLYKLNGTTASTAAKSRMRRRIFVFCCGVIGRIAPAPFPIEQPMSVPLAKC